MSDGMQDWARLADADHLRRSLVDLSAFLVAYAALTDYLISSTHDFLGGHESLIDGYKERDRRLARCDPAQPTSSDIADAVDFFVEGGALTTADADRIAALGTRRDESVSGAHRLLVEDSAQEMLSATLDLRDILRRAARWWFVEIETAIDPAILQGSDPDQLRPVAGTELILDYVLRVAQAAAEPD